MKMIKTLLIILVLLFLVSGPVFAEGGYTKIPVPEEEFEFENDGFRWYRAEATEPIENENLMEYRGIDFYPEPYAYGEGGSDLSLEALLSIEEVNFVQVRFFLYQDDIDSTEIDPGKEQMEELKRVIRRIHETGRGVSLKPHLIVDDDRIWGGEIRPSNIDEWFSSYQEAIIPYVQMAEEEEVELLSVANEMVTLWRYSDYWERVVEMMRDHFSGKLTVKMNSWWQESYFRWVLTFDWFASLDYIGMAPYFDLVGKRNPSLQEIKDGWYDSRHGMNVVWQLEEISRQFETDIIFLEIGFRSAEGTSMEPWNYEEVIPRRGSGTVPSQKEQSLATQAVFEVFGDKEWVKGMFWFYWPTKVAIDSTDTSWTIPAKEVEEVIWENFRKEWQESLDSEEED